MSYADASRRVDISRPLSTCVLIVCTTIAALSAYAPTASASPIITAVPSSSSVVQNGLFTVDFTLDDFSDLFAFQMGVVYDASLLSVVGVTEGSHMASGGGTSFFEGLSSGPGLLSFIANSMSGSSTVSGGGTLFSVQFQAIGLAGSIANFAAFFDPGLGDGLYDSLFNGTIPAVQGGSISIGSTPTGVPEPSTLLSFLLGAAMCGAAGRRGWRRASPAR